MRIYLETREITKNDLRLLSVKTGKSISTLKRMKKTHTYLAYSALNGTYTFFGQSNYLLTYAYKSCEEFFNKIEQLELLKALQ